MNAPRQVLALWVVVGLGSGCGGLGLWSAPHESGTGSGSTSTGGGTTASTTGASTTSGGTTSNTTSGTGSTTGTSGGTTTGTTTGSCGGQTAPAIHCARADGSTSWFVVGDAPVIACTVDPGLAPQSWSGSTDPSLFTVDARSAPQSIYVGLPATNVPIGFGDTQVAVTITATFCPGVSSSDVVHLPVVGNNLAADHWNGVIDAFNSGGGSLGNFGGSVQLGKVSMLAVLDDGDVLAGSSTRLAELDRNGVLVRDFDVSDHNGQPLFPDCGSGCTVEPWGAAQASDGTIWVTANQGRDSAGLLYQFNGSGQYLGTIPAPPSPSITWLPLGITRRADGAMLVGVGYEHDPGYLAIYPAGSTSGSYGNLSIPACTGLSDGGSYQCGTNTAGEAGISGVIADPDGTLYIANIWEFDDDGDIAAYDATSLQFKRGGIHTTDVSDFYYNRWFREFARAGDWLLVGDWIGSSCIYALDTRFMLPVGPGPGSTSSYCYLYDPNADFHSVAHLGPNP